MLKRTRKNNKEEKTEIIEEPKDYSLVKEKIRDENLDNVLKENFMPYSMSVITSRALVAIDGLKPSHRKVLYTMYKMGLLTGDRSKSATIAGRVLHYNPHSDASAYETMVRLSADNESLLTPLIDSKGNFGKHYSRDMAYSASRYTEAKLAPIANEYFNSINKNTVKFVPNYDATTTEPTLLPVTFPSILANESEGIAVGMASKIASFNLSELCDAAILRIKNKKADLLKVMKGPDFPTGGYILYEDEIMRGIYENGTGLIKMRGKYRYNKKNKIIEIYEIPYSTTIEEIIDAVIAGIKNGKIKEINDIRDESDLKGLKIAIDIKRGVDPDDLMKKLCKLTPFQTTFGCNFNVLIDGRPQVLGVYQILDKWTDWRRECVKNELNFDLIKVKHDLHVLKGLEKIILDINKAIRIIKNTENDEMVVPNLMKGFKIDEEQATYVAEMKLRNLNKDYLLNKTKNIESLENEINQLENTISNISEIDKIIIKQLTNIKRKYGIARKTEIIPFNQKEESDLKEYIIQDYNAKLFITKDGYIKKVPLTAMRADVENKIKENDLIKYEYDITNKTELLFFTNKQIVYKRYAYDLKDSKASEFGEYANNLFKFDEDEYLIFATPINAAKYLLIGFKNGKVAKIPLSAYETKFNRKKMEKAFSDASPVLNMFIANDKDVFGMNSKNGRIMLFKASQISLKASRTTLGIQTLNILKTDNEIDRFDKAENFHLPEKKYIKAMAPKIPFSGIKAIVNN